MARTRQEVTDLSFYKAGVSIRQISDAYGVGDIIKLGSNENPYGPNFKIMDYMQQALLQVNRYPEDGAPSLVRLIADKHHLNINQVLLGNGSSELLDLIVQAFIGFKDEVIISAYAFSLYRVLCQLVGAEVVNIAEPHYQIDLAEMVHAIGPATKAIFITNPGNPTGTYLSYDNIKYFLEKVPANIIVVIDEAYYEYVHAADYQTVLPLLSCHSNLIITRTFSKAYGLAGLRVGYMLAHPQVIKRLKNYRKPFAVNSIAIAAACATLANPKFLEGTVAANKIERERVCQTLVELALSFIPSVTNFIAIDLKRNAEVIYEKLLSEGIIMRTLAEYCLPNHLRFTLGTKEENTIALNHLVAILKSE